MIIRLFLVIAYFLLTQSCVHGDSGKSLPSTLVDIFDTKNGDFDAPAFQGQLTQEGAFWKNHEKILFLAEGSSDWTDKWSSQRVQFAESIKALYPHIDVWASDLEVPKLQNPQVHVLAIDHRALFPSEIKGQKFDGVIGMRILCHCHRVGPEYPTDKMMCGGLYSHEQSLMEQFLREVRSLLDPKNPISFAFLEGEEKDPKTHDSVDKTIEEAQIESRKNWNTVMDKLNKDETPFLISFVPTKNDTKRYKGILITVK